MADRSLELQAIRVGHDAAVRFLADHAAETAEELDHMRRTLAYVLKAKGRLPYPSEEELRKAVGDDDAIAVINGMLMFQPADARAELMQERFEEDEPKGDPEGP